MISKEAIYGIVKSINNTIPDANGNVNVVCEDTILNDLEVLKILKRIVKIVDCSKHPITSPDDQLVILSGGEIKNVEDYDKIKRWLEND